METEFPCYTINRNKVSGRKGRSVAKKRKAVKPIKKTTDEVIEAISKAMSLGTYYFTDHGDKKS